MKYWTKADFSAMEKGMKTNPLPVTSWARQNFPTPVTQPKHKNSYIIGMKAQLEAVYLIFYQRLSTFTDDYHHSFTFSVSFPLSAILLFKNKPTVQNVHTTDNECTVLTYCFAYLMQFTKSTLLPPPLIFSTWCGAGSDIGHD